jgi:hypothetical protein
LIVAPLTFTLTRAQLETKRMQLLNQANILLDGDSGQFTAENCTVRFGYVEPMLTIVVVSKPWIYPESAVAGKITSWFQS